MFFKILKYTGIVVGVCAASEVVYAFVKLYARRCAHISPPAIIHEVIFSNHYSGCCTTTSKEELSQCKNSYCIKKNINKIIAYINSAKSSILLSMYIFTCQELADAILNAHDRGIKIRVISEETMAFSTGSQLSRMSLKNIPVRFAVKGNLLMHHKFCLIDVEKQTSPDLKEPSVLPPGGVLMTGSLNWTMSALSKNYDNILITSDETLIDCYHREFEEMWRLFGVNWQEKENGTTKFEAKKKYFEEDKWL